MHIKYVVVEGFRVYRDRIELAPLSPKHNVVGEPPDPPRFTPRAGRGAGEGDLGVWGVIETLRTHDAERTGVSCVPHCS